MWSNLEMNEVRNASGIKILGTPVGTQEFAQLLVPPDRRRKTSCGKPSSGSPICNARGRCLSSVQADATTSSGPCLRLTQLRTRKGTMRGCSGPWHLFWKGCQVMPTSRQAVAQDIASLPVRKGGLGIQSASWLAPAALVKADFGQSNFGQSILVMCCCVMCCCCCCCCVVVVVCCCCVLVLGVGCWCGCWFWTLRFPPCAGPPYARPPKISLIFPLPPPFSLFLSLSLGVFSLNFGSVFEGRDNQMCTFGLSDCRVKPRRLWGPPALDTTARELQTRTFERSGASETPPKFHEKTPRERQKERKREREREKKKREILGPPPFGAPPFVVPRFEVPPFGAPPFGSRFFLGLPHPLGPTMTHTRTRNGLAKKMDWPKKWFWPKSVSSAAFWASWAGALPMLEKRLPPLAAEIATILEGGCLGELQWATRVLNRRGL